MPDRSQSERLEILEQKVEAIQALPARVAAVELQILQFRDEVRVAFSAIDGRCEAIDGRFEAIDLRFEAIDRRFEAIDRRFEAVDRRFDSLAEEVRTEIRQGDEETRRYMRMLHEEVLERFALMQEGRRRRKR
jgi:seryl-tRNA(Sec) selenium transferase